MNRSPIALFLAIFALSVSPGAVADDSRVVYETEIDADIDAVWNAFTTNEGLQSWMAPLAEIDLTVGGRMKANYNRDGKIGDSATIENTILSFDPKRMLSLKASKFPEGFPFEDAAKSTWSVFYFSELPSSRTKITVVGLGYTDSEQSRRMRAFFAAANEHSLGKLNEALQKDR
ncbi:MAG: SRPBCC domain-containing protein [Planctomycetaceae bacterium]|nr:SRPBCC domain-containing protein [Planctomycetaceae bacterium]